MPIKNKLREILDEKGIKQIWLADRVDVTRGTISNIINNRYNTTLELAFKIAQELNMPLTEIFYYEKD